MISFFKNNHNKFIMSLDYNYFCWHNLLILFINYKMLNYYFKFYFLNLIQLLLVHLSKDKNF